jgi:hypothetical protein
VIASRRQFPAAAACLGVLLSASVAIAQSADNRPVRRIEASIGGAWIAGAPMGSGDAALRANQTAPAPFRIFTTDSRMQQAPGVDARVGFALTRSLVIEAGFMFSRPELRTEVTSDVENAAALTVGERIDQYFADGSVLWLIDRFRIGSRTVPFVSAGAGYLRQLHEGLTLIETGQVFHAGGGVKHWLSVRDRRFIRAVGVRGDVGVYVLKGGVDLEDRPRPHGAASGSVFVTF